MPGPPPILHYAKKRITKRRHPLRLACSATMRFLPVLFAWIIIETSCAEAVLYLHEPKFISMDFAVRSILTLSITSALALSLASIIACWIRQALNADRLLRRRRWVWPIAMAFGLLLSLLVFTGDDPVVGYKNMLPALLIPIVFYSMASPYSLLRHREIRFPD